MQKSEDVVNLFQKFGGQAEGYQEIGKQDVAHRSRERWPLLQALGQGEVAVLPPARPGPTQAAAPIDFSPSPREAAPAPVIDMTPKPMLSPRDNGVPPVLPATAATPFTPPPAPAPAAPAAAYVAPGAAAASPLSRLGRPPAEAAPAPAAPNSPLQNLFDQLAHRTPAPAAAAPSMSQLWKRLGGGS